MKTFKDIKKGDKLFVVNEGTGIPGFVEIIYHTAQTDYREDLPCANTTIHGIEVDNPFGGNIPICFDPDATSSGMYFTTPEEAQEAAIKKCDEKDKEINRQLNDKLNEFLKLHEQSVLMNIRKVTWEKSLNDYKDKINNDVKK